MCSMKHIPSMHAWKDRHLGESCVIVGTGPSLLHTNLQYAKDVSWFGVNGFYSHPLLKYCNYYCVTDPIIWRNNSEQIAVITNKIDQTFLSVTPTEIKPKHYMLPKTTYLTRRSKEIFEVCEGWGEDFQNGTGWCLTVIIFALELAYYMGFSNVTLVGCDCNYANDFPHFDGSPVIAPREDWSPVFTFYKSILRKYVENNRYIHNSTVGGNLEVFPRIKLEKFIDIHSN